MINPAHIIQVFGLIGVLICVFSESAFFIGLFLPGDTLLFISGYLASGGHISLFWLLALGSLAAILGDSFGYFLGHRYGRKLFERRDSIFFKKEYLEKAEEFYTKYGKGAIIIGRFLPVVRAFVASIAGASSMNYKDFIIYNILGGVLWVWSLSLAGYFLGEVVPNPDKYIFPIIITIILASSAPVIYNFSRSYFKK